MRPESGEGIAHCAGRPGLSTKIVTLLVPLSRPNSFFSERALKEKASIGSELFTSLHAFSNIRGRLGGRPSELHGRVL